MTNYPIDPSSGAGNVPPPGYYPPPPGYGPPPGYPPPPGYGPPPGYPPPPGYGPPPGYPPTPGYGPPPYDIGQGLKWSWNAFTQNALPLILGMLIWGVVVGAVFGIPYTVAFVSAVPDYSVDGSSAGLQFGAVGIVLIVFAALAMLLAFAAAASAIITGFLKIADGQPVTVASFLKPNRFGPMLALQLLIIVAVLIGTVLCIVPGIIVGFLTLFAPFLLLDRGLSPVDAIKESIAIVKRNIVTVLLMYLINAALSTVGQLACLVGLLVAIPVGYLFQIYTYRQLSGRPVAPLPR